MLKDKTNNNLNSETLSGTTSNPLCFYSSEKMRGEKKNRKKRGTGDKEENPERVSAPESCIMINDSFFKW